MIRDKDVVYTLFAGSGRSSPTQTALATRIIGGAQGRLPGWPSSSWCREALYVGGQCAAARRPKKLRGRCCTGAAVEPEDVEETGAELRLALRPSEAGRDRNGGRRAEDAGITDAQTAEAAEEVAESEQRPQPRADAASRDSD